MIIATQYVNRQKTIQYRISILYFEWVLTYMLPWVEGEEGAIHGNTTHCNAVVKQAEPSKRSNDWQKNRTDAAELMDISSTKYNGSPNRQLVIDSVCKKDEGKYLVFLSELSNRNICWLFLKIFSDCMRLQTHGGTLYCCINQKFLK